jgi:undecaprenyl-diphosphatase
MNKKNILKISIFSLIIFFLIAINLNATVLLDLDSMISNFVINNQHAILNSICTFIGLIFEPIYLAILLLLLAIILWTRKFRKEAIYFIFISSSSIVLGFFFKHFVIRTRPVIQFVQETGFSFPSGHALMSVILFGSLFYFSLKLKHKILKKILVTSCLLGILIFGLSRVYLNVHWFSDVIGGYFLGIAILFIGIFFLEDKK